MNNNPTYQQVRDSIDKIRTLGKIQVAFVKNRDIVLIVGPTGSGKSTFLNMLAGSKLTCEINQTGDWEIQADPQIAAIGGLESCTFMPNYWLDQKFDIIYCDCPGFKDSRGYQYDIAKSQFLYTIGHNAKSIKVVTILDWHTLKGAKGALFMETIREIDILIQDFNFTSECIFICTKIPSVNTKTHVKNHMKKKIEIDFPEDRIFLIHDPVDEKITCLDNSVISMAPSLKHKCRIPLSKQNWLKLESFAHVIKAEIESHIECIKSLLQFGLISYYQNNLNATVSEIELFQNFYKSSYQIIKSSTSFQDFELNVSKICSQLKNKNCAKHSSLIRKSVTRIKHFFEEEAFLFQLLAKENDLNKYFKMIEASQTQNKKKGQNITLVDLNFFGEFLQNLSIDINNIKTSVHKKLTENPPQTSVTCEGIVKYSGKKIYYGEVPYSGTQPYSGRVCIEQSMPYKGKVNYKKKIPYNEYISVPKCRHANGCPNCNHSTTIIDFQGSYIASGQIEYKGNVYVGDYHNFNGSAKYAGKAQYKGNVLFEGSAPYSKQQNAKCSSDHHICSCNELAYLCFNGMKLLANLDFFIFVLQTQNHEMAHSGQTPAQVGLKHLHINAVALQDFRRFQNYSQLQIKEQLHMLLTQGQAKFQHSYEGKTPYAGKQSYSGQQKYDGRAKYSDFVECKGSVRYSGRVNKKINQFVKHEVMTSSCYFNCLLCKGGSYWYQQEIVEINETLYEKYSGELDYCVKLPYKGQVKYDGKVNYYGEVTYMGEADYSGKKEVVCDKNHHTCKSCDKWTEYVELLKAIYEDIEEVKAIIGQNGIKLEEWYVIKVSLEL